jgi:hypothetical protein
VICQVLHLLLNDGDCSIKKKGGQRASGILKSRLYHYPLGHRSSKVWPPDSKEVLEAKEINLMSNFTQYSSFAFFLIKSPDCHSATLLSSLLASL